MLPRSCRHDDKAWSAVSSSSVASSVKIAATSGSKSFPSSSSYASSCSTGCGAAATGATTTGTDRTGSARVASRLAQTGRRRQQRQRRASQRLQRRAANGFAVRFRQQVFDDDAAQAPLAPAAPAPARPRRFRSRSIPLRTRPPRRRCLPAHAALRRLATASTSPSTSEGCTLVGSPSASALLHVRRLRVGQRRGGLGRIVRRTPARDACMRRRLVMRGRAASGDGRRRREVVVAPVEHAERVGVGRLQLDGVHLRFRARRSCDQHCSPARAPGVCMVASSFRPAARFRRRARAPARPGDGDARVIEEEAGVLVDVVDDLLDRGPSRPSALRARRPAGRSSCRRACGCSDSAARRS